MPVTLRVLIVEDSEDDAALLLQVLKRGPWQVEHERVETAAAMSAALDKGGWDVIIADYSMPQFSGPAALALANSRAKNLPFILISGAVGEELAVQSMNAGADDYISKENLARLVPAVERELHKAGARREARRDEQRVHATEGRYPTLFECAPDGILIADRESYYIDANPSMCRLLGYSREELIGTHASSIIIQHGPDHTGQGLTGGKTSGVHDREWQLRRKDGSVFAAEVIATVMPDGNMMAMVRDVTERKLAEATLAKTLIETERVNREITFQNFALDQHAIVAVTDRAGRITYANDKFCQISGYSRAELIGQDHRIVNSGFHSKAFFKELYATIAGGSVWRGEIRNRAKDGHIYWVDTTIVPFTDGTGRVTRYVAIRADITERKRAEEEIERVNAQLTQQNHSLAALTEQAHRFVDDVSHEFRTPLAVIKEFGAIIADGLAGGVTKEQKEYLGVIDNAVLDLNQMVEDFLDSSKLRAGRLRVDRREQPIDAIFTRIRPGLQKKAASRAITIVERIDPRVPPMFADEEKVRRVIMNLATNAIKFSPEGSQVELWAREAAEGGVEIGVTDQGRGLALGDLKQLFERFRQLPSSDAPSIKGFGLGLNIARQLVWLNLGKMNVVSEPDRGSMFSFTLPTGDPRMVLDRFFSRLAECEEAAPSVTVLAATPQGPMRSVEAMRLFLSATTRPTDVILEMPHVAECGFLLVGPTASAEGWIARLSEARDRAIADPGSNKIEGFRIHALGTFAYPADAGDAMTCALEQLTKEVIHA
jgi:PAS domain S-box-containing protein